MLHSLHCIAILSVFDSQESLPNADITFPAVEAAEAAARLAAARASGGGG